LATLLAPLAAAPAVADPVLDRELAAIVHTEQ
jgi:hypothetical protein